ncbi:MAG: DUF349 domain-containing protein, partial [Duncaniella sp.]|nr:DUF349 domain-containing protein [Duncaniella sp.]
SDAVWQRFMAACDHFFDRKKQDASGTRRTEQANLKLKQEIIDRLAEMTAPDAPANLRVTYDKATGTATFSWDAPADDTTPSEALRYNLYIMKDGENTISAVIPADPATGFVKTDELNAAIASTRYSVKVPMEDAVYTWGVQAIDNGKAASRFATAKFNPAKTSSVKKKIVTGIEITVVDGTVHYNLGDSYTRLVIRDTRGITVATASTPVGTISSLTPGVYIATATAPGKSESTKFSVN